MRPKDSDEEIYRKLAKLGVNVNALKEVNPTRKALEELLAGLLKLMGQKFYPEKEDGRVESVQACDHILAIYPDMNSKFEEAFSFLKDGRECNEAVMFITDDRDREDVLKRMSRDWNVDAYELEKRGDIMVRSTTGWYFPGGVFDSDVVIEKWKMVSEIVKSRGKAGLRVFADTSTFFEHGFSRELVEYEAQLGGRFDIPLTAICAYTEADVKNLAPLQMKTLHECHRIPAWT